MTERNTSEENFFADEAARLTARLEDAFTTGQDIEPFVGYLLIQASHFPDNGGEVEISYEEGRTKLNQALGIIADYLSADTRTAFLGSAERQLTGQNPAE